MSKKVDSMTPEERAKKYGNEIMGIGIFYLVCYIITILLYSSILLSNFVSIVFIVVQIAMTVFMIIGGLKKNRTGVRAALAFEIYLIISSIVAMAIGQGAPGLVAIIVMIGLPFDIIGLSKAIKEMGNPSVSQNVDANSFSPDNINNPF